MSEDTATMPKGLKDLTVAELENLLNTRRKDLKKLQRRREKLVQQLEELDSNISELQGMGGGSAVSTGGTRPRNEKPLNVVVRDVLGRYKKGLPLAKLAEKVLETGYQTQSSNFNNTVYQCVYKAEDIVRDEDTGNYVLKG